MGHTGLFSPVYRHPGITLNCPVTFQKFSCHMELSQGWKMQNISVFNKLPFQNASTNNLWCISSYKYSCHGPFYVLLIESIIVFILIDSLIFQHGLCSKSMQSSSWRWQDCWNTDYKVKNWLLYASLMGYQLSLEAGGPFREFRWSCADEQPIADLVQSGFVCSCIFNGFHCWPLGKISLPVPAGCIFSFTGWLCDGQSPPSFTWCLKVIGCRQRNGIDHCVISLNLDIGQWKFLAIVVVFQNLVHCIFQSNALDWLCIAGSCLLVISDL